MLVGLSDSHEWEGQDAGGLGRARAREPSPCMCPGVAAVVHGVLQAGGRWESTQARDVALAGRNVGGNVVAENGVAARPVVDTERRAIDHAQLLVDRLLLLLQLLFLRLERPLSFREALVATTTATAALEARAEQPAALFAGGGLRRRRAGARLNVHDLKVAVRGGASGGGAGAEAAAALADIAGRGERVGLHARAARRTGRVLGGAGSRGSPGLLRERTGH